MRHIDVRTRTSISYWVTDAGEVYSWCLDRREPLRRLRQSRMQPSPHYCTVTLGGQRRYVHELVAAAFLGPRPPGQHVSHIDGNPINNRVENLWYREPAAHVRHDRRLRDWRRPRPMEEPERGLIGELYEDGWSVAGVAVLLDRDYTVIARAVRAASNLSDSECSLGSA